MERDWVGGDWKRVCIWKESCCQRVWREEGGAKGESDSGLRGKEENDWEWTFDYWIDGRFYGG